MKVIIDRLEEDDAFVHEVDNNAQFRIPQRLLPENTQPGDSLNVKINVNNASAAQLQKLKGIGPALSEKIVEYRKKNGLFENINQVEQVPGMKAFGGSRFEQIKNDITVGRISDKK